MDNCNAKDNCQRENRIMRDTNIYIHTRIGEFIDNLHGYMCVRERTVSNKIWLSKSLLVEAMLGFRTVSKNVPVEGILSAYQLRMQ